MNERKKRKRVRETTEKRCRCLMREASTTNACFLVEYSSLSFPTFSPVIFYTFPLNSRSAMNNIRDCNARFYASVRCIVRTRAIGTRARVRVCLSAKLNEKSVWRPPVVAGPKEHGSSNEKKL